MSPEVTYKIRRPVEMLIIRAITDIRFHSLLLIFCYGPIYTIYYEEMLLKKFQNVVMILTSTEQTK